MTFAKATLIALAAGLVSLGAQAQSAMPAQSAATDSSQPNGAAPVPEQKTPKAKRTPAEKKATVKEAEKSGAGTDSSQPNGAAPPMAKHSKMKHDKAASSAM